MHSNQGDNQARRVNQHVACIGREGQRPGDPRTDELCDQDCCGDREGGNQAAPRRITMIVGVAMRVPVAVFMHVARSVLIMFVMIRLHMVVCVGHIVSHDRLQKVFGHQKRYSSNSERYDMAAVIGHSARHRHALRRGRIHRASLFSIAPSLFSIILTLTLSHPILQGFFLKQSQLTPPHHHHNDVTTFSLSIHSHPLTHRPTPTFPTTRPIRAAWNSHLQLIP